MEHKAKIEPFAVAVTVEPNELETIRDLLSTDPIQLAKDQYMAVTKQVVRTLERLTAHIKTGYIEEALDMVTILYDEDGSSTSTIDFESCGVSKDLGTTLMRLKRLRIVAGHLDVDMEDRVLF